MTNSDAATGAELMNMQLLERRLAEATSQDVKEVVVNAPFEQTLAVASLFLGFITLLVANKKTGMIDRVALSKTELANNTLEVSYVAFDDIKIPLNNPDNIIAKAIANNKSYDTTDWYYTFTPALTGEQARINQASGGIAYTCVYPLAFNNGGAISFSYYQYAQDIGKLQYGFMEQYTELVSAALAQKIIEA